MLLTGLGFGESPRWHDGRLWLANWGSGDVIAVGEDGKSEVTATIDETLPFSIDWLPDGRLLVIRGPEAELLRQEPDGSWAMHADLSDFGSFNELVVDPRGNAYVNGRTIVLVTPQGEAREVAKDVAWGNGMAITPDNRTLIVAESHANRLTAFDIEPDGGLSHRRVWAELGEGTPDGLCLHPDGTAWYADVPNKWCQRVREGGEVLDTIPTDQGCFACELGGADGHTLFLLTAQWLGMSKMDEGLAAKSGQLLAMRVEA